MSPVEVRLEFVEMAPADSAVIPPPPEEIAAPRVVAPEVDFKRTVPPDIV